MEAQRHRPLGVTILAVLASIAYVVNAFVAFVFLGALPFILVGGLGFFGQALLGGLLRGTLAVLWSWVAVGLWNLNPDAWIFVVILSILNLILDLVSVLGASTWQAVLPSIVLNAVILIYALSPGVKAAFGHPERRP